MTLWLEDGLWTDQTVRALGYLAVASIPPRQLKLAQLEARLNLDCS